MPAHGDLIRIANGIWGAYQAPLLAAFAALLAGLAARGAKALAPAAGPFGVAVGWAVLLPVLSAPRLVLHPRGVADHLALPALAALGCALVLPRLGGRGPALLGVALAGFTGWWLAGAAPRAEFWRAWLAASAAVGALAYGAGADARRLSAAALALPGALLAVGAPPGWTMAALVPAAASAALALVRPSAPMLPLAALVAAAGAAAGLGAGRLVRGAQAGAVDLACLVALPAPWLVPPLARRMGRLGWLAPPLVAALAAGAAALLARFLPRR